MNLIPSTRENIILYSRSSDIIFPRSYSDDGNDVHPSFEETSLEPLDIQVTLILIAFNIMLNLSFT